MSSERNLVKLYKNKKNMPNNILLTKTFAIWALSEARKLITEGIGREYDPLEIDTSVTENMGYLDEISMADSQLWNWANSLLFLCKALAGVLSKELLEDPNPFDTLGEEEF